MAADKFISHRKVTACDDLTACAGLNVNNDWRFQIECENAGMSGNDNEQLGISKIPHHQWGEFAAGNPHFVFGHESPWTDDRQGDITATCRLQPSQGVVARVGQQCPSLTVFQARQSAGKMQQIVIVYINVSEPRCVESHG